jgi:hypothetical protein
VHAREKMGLQLLLNFGRDAVRCILVRCILMRCILMRCILRHILSARGLLLLRRRVNILRHRILLSQMNEQKAQLRLAAKRAEKGTMAEPVP